MIYYEDYVRDSMLTYNKSKGNGFTSKICSLHNLIHAYHFPCKDCKLQVDNLVESDSYCIDYSNIYGIR